MTSQHFQNDADGWGDWGDWNSNSNAIIVKNNNNNPPTQQPPLAMNHNFNYSNKQTNQPVFQNQDLPVRPPQFAPPSNSAPIYSPFGYQAQSISTANDFLNNIQDNEFVSTTYYQPAHLQPVYNDVSQQATPLNNQLSIQAPVFEKVTPAAVYKNDNVSRPAFKPHRTSSPYQLSAAISNDLQDFGISVGFQPEASNSPPPPPPASSEDLVNTNYLLGGNLPPPPSSVFETINRQFEPIQNLENQQHFEVEHIKQNIDCPSRDVSQYSDASNVENLGTLHQTALIEPFNAENIVLQEPKTTSNQSSYPIKLMNLESRTENMENMEFSLNMKQFARAANPISMFSNNSSENIYPENRERLDDTAPINSSDRHNYLVTGQLSQEMNTTGSVQFQVQQETSLISQQNETLPPPGLARLVVGQTENNQEQLSLLSTLPPGLNRMVLGTEVDRDDYMSSQRQADGESQPIPPVSAFNPPQQLQNPHQSYTSNHFNIADRNQYLAAGGGNSNINSQRVIAGVESDNSLPVIAPMQQLSLDIQGDPETSGVSNIGGLNIDERNINADGENIDDDQPQVTPQTTREEAIEGANDDSGGAATRQQPKKTYSTDDSAKNESNRSEKARKDRRTNDRRYKDEDYVASNDSDSDKNDNVKCKDSRYKRANHEGESSDHYKFKKEKYTRDKERGVDKYGSRQRRNKADRENFESDGSKYDTERSDREKNSDRKYRRTKPSNRNSEDDSRERNPEKYYKNSMYKNREEKERTDKYRREGKRPPKERSDRKNYYEDDRERYNRRYEHEEDNYRTRSRNALDRDYLRRSKDRELRGERKFDPSQSYYGAAQNYGFDTNYSNYYSQQQQYFETLRRTNPQAYSEYYRNYYAMMQAHMQRDVISNTEEIAGSTHSGYSSNNEKDRLSHQRYTGSVHSSLQTSYIDQSDYAGHYQSHQNQQEINNTFHSIADQIAGLNDTHYARKSNLSSSALVSGKEEEQHRLTPHKFNCAHGLVKLTNGIIASVDTSGANYQIKLENMVVNDNTRKIFQTYPGPLVRGVTNKKSIIEFCEEQLKSDSLSMFHSLWKSDICVNGVNADTLKNANKASYTLLWSYLILLVRQNGHYTEADISELLMKNVEEFVNAGDEKKTIHESPELLSKASGAVNEEISDQENESSSEENLASNTMSTKSQISDDVSSGKLSEQDILHKFRDYLLYGNINDALEFATDHNLWGHALFLASKVDRRQHANVMLKFANKLRYNDPLQTLYQIMSGRIPASVTTNLDDKLGDWRPHLAMIISNCTDNPELVKRSIVSLGDSLAIRNDVFGSQFCYLLVDPKFSEYNDLPNNLSNSPNSGKIILVGASHKRPFKEFASNEAIIITEIYEYARSLNNEKFVLPEFQKYKFILANNMLDQGMQLKCLLYLEQIAHLINQMPDAFNPNFIAKIYSLADKLKFYDPVMEKWYEDNYNNNGTLSQNIEDLKWLQDLGQVLYEAESRADCNADFDVQAPVHYFQEHQPTVVDPNSPAMVSNAMEASSGINSAFNENTGFYSPPQPIENYVAPYVEYHKADSNYEYHNPIPDENRQLPDHNTFSQYQDQNVSNDNIHQTQFQPEQTQQPEFDYWSNQPAPTITLGNSMSNKPEYSTNDSPNKIVNSTAAKKAVDQQNKSVKGKTSVDSATGVNNSGWLGGIWNKITLKPKNQMILPDDKNPSISWDDKQKKWVNKDEDETEAEAFKPPPKMGGMLMQQAPQIAHNQAANPSQVQSDNPQSGPMTPNRLMSIQQMQSKPQGAQIAVATSPSQMTTQQNMFKMQKGRNLKKSYVDILGNSGQTVSQEPVLAPAIESFISPMDNLQQQAGTPQIYQFYNPNDFQQ